MEEVRGTLKALKINYQVLHEKYPKISLALEDNYKTEDPPF